MVGSWSISNTYVGKIPANISLLQINLYQSVLYVGQYVSTTKNIVFLNFKMSRGWEEQGIEPPTM